MSLSAAKQRTPLVKINLRQQDHVGGLKGRGGKIGEVEEMGNSNTWQLQLVWVIA